MPTSSNARQLQAVEADIHLGESLFGRITALAARSAAQCQPHRAREACRLRTEAEELLRPLYAMRGRLRHDLAGPS